MSINDFIPGYDRFKNLFAKDEDPEKAANEYYNKIPGETKDYYDPYINTGKDSLDKLKSQYEQMMSNPGDYFNKLGSGYQQSPGYAATLRQAMAGANNAAALGGGGGLGTPGHINNTASAAGDVANKDYEQYINHILGLNSEGIKGEQGLEEQGYGASTDYAKMLAQLRSAQAQNAGNAATGRNQSRSQDWSNLFSLGGSLAGGLL